ncbi:winged helix DNA-binding domain-containing protein [Crossiella sp. SN42]|uniref:winged helix DNA-binding domain-containing protein n=1 Tax=Crossiella sp. SN42 TaxID=2944808 RepID=UPI00207D390F|nr:winged helix DNA-binding domain-containing protein [Crossiella sp. SN42]MCO1575287.1 winged helix DNA-binding domain-containing protein [Crossiella sp. SN42]
MTELDWATVCAVRMERHALSTPTPGIAEAARAMCGVHAQVMSAAELSLGLRTGATRTQVREALWQRGELVKTFGLRGTVHLLTAADLPLWTAALSAVPLTVGYAPALRLTPDQTDAVVAALDRVCRTGEFTMDELTPAVVAETGSWAGDLVVPSFSGFWPRWATVIHTAAFRGALCFGPDRDRKTTYTSPHRHLSTAPPMTTEQALAELLRRYLYSYGPATPAHFARWLSAPRPWAERLFTACRDRLRPVRLGETEAWLAADDNFEPAQDAPGLRLLPYFDAYQVGCHPRESLFPGKTYLRALNRGQAGNYPVVLVDGTVAGVWHQRRSGRRIAVTVEPCGRWRAGRRRMLAEQVDRVAAVLEATAELTVGTVTVGPHA